LAVLKKKADGHYIILGPDFPGMPCITRQIQPEGVEWLAQRGIRDGNRVPPDYIQLLKDGDWVWTAGDGPPPQLPPDPDAPTPAEEQLLSFIEHWSRNGDPEVLERELDHRGGRVSIQQCFHKAFLSWVVAIEESISLHLCDLSPHEIHENFLILKIAQFPKLHRQLWDRERGKWVICHWMAWISEVYQLKRQKKACPDLWQGRVHGVIYNLLDDLDKIQIPPPPDFWRRNKAYIRWNLREDVIELVFPEQIGPENSRIDFDLNGILQTLKLKRRNGACRWKEEVFRIDDPEPPIYWECVYYRNEELCGKSFSHFPAAGILLWDEAGVYLEPEIGSEKLLTEKHYYLLIHADRKIEIESLGITLTSENELIEPVGWWDWSAFHIFLPASLEKLGPYSFQRPKPSLSIELSAPVEHPSIEFAHQVPVYLGDWPLCRFKNVAEGLSAKLIISGDADLSTIEFQITDNESFNLDEIDSLKHRFGLVTLELMALSHKGRERQEKQFIRLPSWNFDVIDDPQHRSVKALMVSGIRNGSIASRDNCEVVPEGQGGFVITVNDPCRNPVVTVSWQNHHDNTQISFSVRLPVNRGTILRYGAELPSWQGLPLTAPSDFLASTREGEIRLEFLHPLPYREVWVKASGDRAVQCGQLLGRVVRIPCHRVRDYLGTRFATLFIKTAAGWEPFLNQVEAPTPQQPQPVPPEIARFAEALWLADIEALQGYWHEAQTHFIQEGDLYSLQDNLLVKTIFLAPHLGDQSGTQELLNTVQVPETGIIRIRHHLRIGLRRDQDLEEARRWVDALPPDSYRTHAEGEWWYRFARQRSTRALGALETSYRLLSSNIWGDPVSAVEAFSLASMSALLGSGEIPSAYPSLQSSYYQLFMNIYNWLSTTLKKIDHILLPLEIPYPLECILVPQDILFLRTCVAQIRQELTLSGQLLAQLEPFSQQFPTCYLLLKARHYRFRGDRGQAVSVYKELIDLQPNIPDKMLQVILDERYSW
jgi:hypothetical protein